MLAWNYRVIYRVDDATKSGYYGIYEVFYSKKGKIKAWTAEMIEPLGESKKELKKDLKQMKKALKKPLLIEKKKGEKIVLVQMSDKVY